MSREDNISREALVEKVEKLKKKDLVELIIWFCEEKDRILFELTKIHIFDKEDYESIKRWKIENLERIMEKLSIKSDHDCCPWCIIYLQKSSCQPCSYRKRHGNCGDWALSFNISTYSKITHKLAINGYLSAISNLPEIIDLVEKFHEKTEKLKEKNNEKTRND